VTWVLILGLILNLIALPLAAKRVLFLERLITSGQPAPDRIDGVLDRLGEALKTQVVKVFGQQKLLKWTVPGAAHFFVFWAFLILATVYLEAYGALFTYPEEFAIPLVGRWDLLGFAQDFIAVMAVIGLAVFAQIRLKNSPKKLGRNSRFQGSHLGGAWVVLFMIFNVVWTMFLFRGAAAAHDNLPYGNGAFVSQGVGTLLAGLSGETLEVLEGVGLLLHIGVMLVFLIIVLNSKHLHIFVAPLNVLFGRQPVALGAAKPLMSGGQVLSLEDADDFDEDTKLGVGAVEDFSWKGMLDFASCTECGRCQSQCPAWNTEKPLSPKLLIMAMRDAAFAKAPYILADEQKREQLLAEDAASSGDGAQGSGGHGHGSTTLTMEVERPLVAPTGDEWFYMPEDGSAVIDPEVLWSCVTCGACVEQCPVDIEHVDHIVDMRRYQVLIESSFPSELNGLFKQMENKGNPWGMNAKARMDWAKDLPFPVKVVGEDVESLDEVDWLFWVGCAGAYEDRAKKTTAAVAELLSTAGVDFAVLGNGETCTGDSARRAGNEFLFQQLAMQNSEVLTEARAKKVVSTCAHCFNTLKNEYAEFGVELEVVHHTQLLNRLVREGRLTPVPQNGAPKRTVTYHDPCYVGRHNQVYTPPRELLSVIPSTEFTEMERNSERSFCCGAGGARMWMEERIGQRINVNRTTEAVGTGAEQIAVGCPFCRVMLSDGLTELQDKGEAREEVEVLDVAQMLLAAVRRDGKPFSGPLPVKDKWQPFLLPDGKDVHFVTDGEVYRCTVPGCGYEQSDERGPAEHVGTHQLEPASGGAGDALAEDQGGDDSRYPATAAHDGTLDPEQAPDRKGDAPAGVIDPTDGKPAAVVDVSDSGQNAEQSDQALPAWVGLDVETILEGDDVDISEFKAKLKAELKEELIAEIKAELEGALNSEDGTSQPVEKTTSGSLFEAKERAGAGVAAGTGAGAASAATSADASEAPAEAETASEEVAEPPSEPAAAEPTVETDAKPVAEEEKPAEKKPAASSEPPPDIDFSGSL
jgi:Fe-S oxidoreductase